MSEELTSERFLGRHVLTGVDVTQQTIPNGYNAGDNHEVVWFELDGVVWRFEEDLDDGYRSRHEDPVEDPEHIMANKFPAIEVEGVHDAEGYEYGYSADLLALNGAAGPILQFGTYDIDDYYPSYCCVFDPEVLTRSYDTF